MSLFKNTIDKFFLQIYCYTAFVNQTIVFCILIRNLNKFIYQPFINSHAKFEQIWIINNEIPTEENV